MASDVGKLFCRPVRYRSDCLRLAGVALAVLALTASACSPADDQASSDDPGQIASPLDETVTVLTSVTTDAKSDGTTEISPVDPTPLVETNQFNLLEPGSYVSDLLSLELEITTTTEFNVALALPGSILIEAPTSTNEAYTGVGFFIVDTLLDSETSGLQRSRLPATVDLTEFLDARDGVEVVDRRDDVLGGLPARVWRIEYTGPCIDCSYEMLFSRTGWVNLWGTFPDQVQELWTVDVPGAPMIIAVEAPREGFDAWADVVQRHLFDGLVFGAPTGFSLERPADPFAKGFGEYGTGRAELVVVDNSRPTIEVGNGTGLAVRAADDRSLLLSVAYPSNQGGFGAAPADGPFPLVVIAPALRDAAIILPADRQLASHGFVVVAVRFPESSFPGNAQIGVPHQPADISFVIDALQSNAFPAELVAVTDMNRIGLVGQSGGATTALGLLAYECCRDERLDAVVAHAGIPYGFESVRLPSSTPILHVVSQGDQVAPIEAVREFHEATDGPTAIAELELDAHLGWLRPESSSYHDAFDLVLAFLDRHLRSGPEDLSAVVDDSMFVDYDER